MPDRTCGPRCHATVGWSKVGARYPSRWLVTPPSRSTKVEAKGCPGVWPGGVKRRHPRSPSEADQPHARSKRPHGPKQAPPPAPTASCGRARCTLAKLCTMPWAHPGPTPSAHRAPKAKDGRPHPPVLFKGARKRNEGAACGRANPCSGPALSWAALRANPDGGAQEQCLRSPLPIGGVQCCVLSYSGRLSQNNTWCKGRSSTSTL